MDASLVHRLAGPSTGKAGLAKDQTEINKIVAEASKGSKFFDEAKRKDAELTEKIERMLKTRDEILPTVDIAKVEASVDQMIAELESKRDLSQVICHVDMDAFYANVEVLDDPSLAGKPFGVSGGVLSTASYEARQFGVRSGMAAFIAKKLCPQLIIVQTHFPRYIEISRQVMEILSRYDPEMSRMGLDEAYLNLTKYCKDNDVTPEECVSQMREAVHKETKLTCSAGIAPNKMLAKICSDKNKPNGQYYLPSDRKSLVNFTHDLPIRKIPGIGRVSERVLDTVGVKTCGDVYNHRASISILDKQLGLESLLCAYLGIGSNVVEPGVRESRKSLGVERTFRGVSDKEWLLAKLEKIATDLAEDLADGGWAARTVTLKYKLDTFQSYTRAKACSKWITSKDDLFSIGKELFLKEYPLKLRLIGLQVSRLKDLRASGALDKFFKKAPEQTSTSRKANADDEEHAMMRKEEEDDITLESDDDDVQEIEPPPKKSEGLAPISKGEPAEQPPPSVSSSSITPSKPQPKPRPLQKCPICSHDFDVDNAGLNAHIDFCLSRGAIMEATSFTGDGAADELGGFVGEGGSKADTPTRNKKRSRDPWGLESFSRAAKRKR